MRKHDRTIRKQNRLPLRDAAVAVVRTLREAGHVAYFAGGCVRDEVMGITPTDYDVATDARPQRIGALFARAYSVGEAFGVMHVRVGGHTIEVATFRKDDAYTDKRHPDAVHFSDAEHDARRRDFTINGLFEDPIEDTIIDYVGGQRDINEGIIRAIGDPQARINEDHLRMLRAVRFAARFEFVIEKNTAEAIRSASEHLQGISRERIGEEVRRMLSNRHRGAAASMMQDLRLDAAALHEPHTANEPVRVARLPEPASYPAALAAWLLDRHGEVGRPAAREIARRWRSALMLSNQQFSALGQRLTVHHHLLHDWRSQSVAWQKRLAASEGFDEALAIIRAVDAPACHAVESRVAELAATGLNPPPLLTGDDLIAAGLDPGPRFKQILAGVYDAQLEGRVRDHAAALALARDLAAHSR